MVILSLKKVNLQCRRLINNNILLNPLLGVDQESISRMLQRYEPGNLFRTLINR